MTKADLVAQVAKKAGLTAKAAKDAVNTIFSTMTDALKRGEKVVVTGFGTYGEEKSARKGRNLKQAPKFKFQPQKLLLYSRKNLKRIVK
jgi:DNA-binding protein HU-beta